MLAFAPRAQAASPKPPPITNNDYAIEFYLGPYIGPVRLTGLSGAYTASAEGIEGSAVQAAAPAVRQPFSFHWFDWDIDADVAIPGAYQGTDFDNRGPNADPSLVARVNHFFYGYLGGQVQLGEFGTSVTGELLQYDANPSAGQQGTTLTFGRAQALMAYGFFGNQLVVGGGLRIVALSLSAQSTTLPGGLALGKTLFTMSGAAPEVGAVLKLNNFPVRFGATVRTTVIGHGAISAATSVDANGVARVGDLVLPTRIELPWELETGFALQLGPRPIDPPWLDPHEMERPVREPIERARKARAKETAAHLAALPEAERPAEEARIAVDEASIRAVEDARLDAEKERTLRIRVARERNWPRERVTVFASMLTTGKSSDAVGFEGFLTQTRELVGQSASWSPRVGLESEPIVNWLHVRVGTYIEPSRFEDGFSRQHFTFGGEVKLFPFSPWGIFGDQIWRLGVSADLAPRYQNFGLGLGAWH